jgi:diaminobutyrate-2-oxoglutarate transaminase
MLDQFIAKHESAVRSYSRHFPVVLNRAEGSYVFDCDGVRYLDFLAGAGSLNYGHNNPVLIDAIIRHLKSGKICQTLDLYSSGKADFIKAMFEHVMLPRGLADYRIQFVGPTGTNSVEAALKLARKVTGRTEVVAFTGGFHGVSLGALAASGERGKREGAGQPLANVLRAPFDGYCGSDINTIALIERMFDDPNSGWALPAAFIVEPIQGEGGLNVASAAWLRQLVDLARRLGSLVIVDEIQSGCGRSGDFFGFEQAGVGPDIICLSKSISGFGLPMAILLIKSEYDVWAPGEHNGTFRGNNLAFATATAALETYWRDDSFVKGVKAKEKLVKEKLLEIAALREGIQVVGRGLMIGLRFDNIAEAGLVSQQCFKHHMIVETCGSHNNTLKLLPPLTTTVDELVMGLDIIGESVCEIGQFGDHLPGAA